MVVFSIKLLRSYGPGGWTDRSVVHHKAAFHICTGVPFKVERYAATYNFRSPLRVYLHSAPVDAVSHCSLSSCSLLEQFTCVFYVMHYVGIKPTKTTDAFVSC